ncbi:hypothetical protein [Piscinibacter defluvii]|uniref:hypothetical protein n=1 Tax=Piscinibacter defluvii TaxID=1796922 RepID=UPI000FDD6481|nr:hypothetical protein [Piscinibacter defluvii]
MYKNVEQFVERSLLTYLQARNFKLVKSDRWFFGLFGGRSQTWQSATVRVLAAVEYDGQGTVHLSSVKAPTRTHLAEYVIAFLERRPVERLPDEGLGTKLSSHHEAIAALLSADGSDRAQEFCDWERRESERIFREATALSVNYESPRDAA